MQSRVLRDDDLRGLEDRPEPQRSIPHRQPAPASSRTTSASRSGATAAGAISGGADPSPAAPGSVHAAANASPRRASSTASGIRSSDAATAAAPAASERRVETPTSGISRACASARALAIPIRSPVNVPGPVPTAIRSRSSQPAPAASIEASASDRSAVVCRGRVSGGGSSRRSIAVSSRPSGSSREPRPPSPRSPCRGRGSSPDHHLAHVRAAVLEADAGGDVRQAGQRRLLLTRPLDERDRVRAEIVGEQLGLLGGERRDPVEVDVRRPAPRPRNAGRS